MPRRVLPDMPVENSMRLAKMLLLLGRTLPSWQASLHRLNNARGARHTLTGVPRLRRAAPRPAPFARRCRGRKVWSATRQRQPGPWAPASSTCLPYSLDLDPIAWVHAAALRNGALSLAKAYSPAYDRSATSSSAPRRRMPQLSQTPSMRSINGI